MSLAIRNTSFHYFCSANLTSIVLNIHYFIGNFKYLPSDHGCDRTNQEI